MRQPSRQMPKAVDQKVGPFGWLFVCVFLGGLLYLAVSNLIVMGALSAIIAISALMGCKHSRHIRQLAAARSGEGICEFARGFNTRTTDTWIIRAVYEELQSCLSIQCPLRASDHLQRDLHVDPDDLVMVIAMQVAERTGRSLAEPERNPYYPTIVTAGDLVNFFNHQPRQACGAAPRWRC